VFAWEAGAWIGVVIHDARAAEPRSPAHLRAVRSGDDLALSWMRRARKDGDDWGAGNPPVEAVEAYRGRLTGGASIREREVVSPDADCHGAEQVTDFPAGGLALVEVTQIGSNGVPGPWTGVQVTIPES